MTLEYLFSLAPIKIVGEKRMFIFGHLLRAVLGGGAIFCPPLVFFAIAPKRMGGSSPRVALTTHDSEENVPEQVKASSCQAGLCKHGNIFFNFFHRALFEKMRFYRKFHKKMTKIFFNRYTPKHFLF